VCLQVFLFTNLTKQFSPLFSGCIKKVAYSHREENSGEPFPFSVGVNNHNLSSQALDSSMVCGTEADRKLLGR